MMSVAKLTLLLIALLVAVPDAAWAHGRRGHVGVYVGPSWGFYSPFYYPPPVIVLPPESPPIYIEQQEAPAPPEQGYWYYCAGAKAYYPYVKECPEGWQKVPPQPAR